MRARSREKRRRSEETRCAVILQKMLGAGVAPIRAAVCTFQTATCRGNSALYLKRPLEIEDTISENEFRRSVACSRGRISKASARRVNLNRGRRQACSPCALLGPVPARWPTHRPRSRAGARRRSKTGAGAARKIERVPSEEKAATRLAGWATLSAAAMLEYWTAGRQTKKAPERTQFPSQEPRKFFLSTFAVACEPLKR